MKDEQQPGDAASQERLMKYGCIGIAVTAVIALVALQPLGPTDWRKKVGATEIQIKEMEQALVMFKVDHKRYPTTAEGLNILINPPPTKTGKGYPNYLGPDEVPTDRWGNPFHFWSPGIHGDHDYEIISLGADGEPGGERIDADVKSWEIQ